MTESLRSPELWDFQAEAVQALRDNISDGVRNQILCAPTGSGKTDHRHRPNDLRGRVEESIISEIEPEAWARCEQAQEAEQESLEDLLDNWASA